MGRLPINAFSPVKTKDSVIKLVGYLCVLKERDRYSVSDCLAIIPDVHLKIFFCNQVVDKGIASCSDIDVNYWIEEGKRINEEKSKRENRRLIELRERQRREERKCKSIERLLNQTNDKLDNKKAPKKKDFKSKNSKIRPTALYRDRVRSHVDDRYIVKGIKASQLEVRCGVIKYGEYELKSVLVEQTVPENILTKIPYRFNLVRSGSGDKKCFMFEPQSDLGLLMAESNRHMRECEIKNNRNSHSDRRIDSKDDLPPDCKNHTNSDFSADSVFALPWTNVVFMEGKMILTHPDTSKWATTIPYIFRHPNLHVSFKDIMGYIQSYCPRFIVAAKDGAIRSVLNFQEFNKMIPHLVEYSEFNESEMDVIERKPTVGSELSLESFKESKAIKKSPYLSLLSKHQSRNYKIHYLLEQAVHKSSKSINDEHGYLFTFDHCRGYLVLVFENTSDESRCSIVFYVKLGLFDQALKYIYRFLSSDLENKRQRIAMGTLKIRDSSILEMKRVSHTNLNEWRSKILKIIRGY